MTQTHPITPPEELLEQWYWTGKSGNLRNALTLAYRAGADQELEATDAWIRTNLKGMLRPANRIADDLRTARRPKPPSLKEQALAELEEILKKPQSPLRSDTETIRRALEALND
jgi:hypothetical protein